MGEVEFIASAAFGMEALVVRELRDLGYPNATVEDGRVHFRGDLSAICRTNMWLRCAERVQVVVADFPARDFDDLFDRVKELPWEDWLADDSKFPVTARCVRSTIRSVPNTQKMVKRAIVERLRKVYSRHWFAETGTEYAIDASILGDRALLTIDTTGDGLHKRGYRHLVGRAPLRETVAAAMIKLSYWNRDRLLVDPFCGSGTIPIEAALIGRNLAPGRNRSFLAENWPQVPAALWSAARQEVKDLENRQPLSIPIVATDRDRHAIKMARQHARQAGVETDIHFEVKDFVAFPTNRDAGILICNPPYGERLGDEDEIRQLYSDMGELLRPLDDWSLYVLTSAEGFERLFGKRADRRRKLYNARIACTYYQYLGPKPAGVETLEDDEPQEREPAAASPPATEAAATPPTAPQPAPAIREEEQPSSASRVVPQRRAEESIPAADNPWTRLRRPTAKTSEEPVRDAAADEPQKAGQPKKDIPNEVAPVQPVPPSPWRGSGSALTEKAGSPAEWRQKRAQSNPATEESGAASSASLESPPAAAPQPAVESQPPAPSVQTGPAHDTGSSVPPATSSAAETTPASASPDSPSGDTTKKPHPWTRNPWPR